MTPKRLPGGFALHLFFLSFFESETPHEPQETVLDRCTLDRCALTYDGLPDTEENSLYILWVACILGQFS